MSVLTEQISPAGARRLVASGTIVTGLSGAVVAGIRFAEMPLPALSMLLGAGVLILAGGATWRSRAPGEGSPEEVEELRRTGRRIVFWARLGALDLLVFGMVVCTLVPIQAWTAPMLALGVFTLLLIVHGFGRLYPSFDPPAAEPWVESLPAAEIPVPEPDPGLARLRQQMDRLRSRNYR